MKIGLGLYGTNGHQIQGQVIDHPRVRWVATASFPESEIPEGVKVHMDLDALLADPEVMLISFCSPRRQDQGEQILRVLRAGKHVLAEKPCCLDEDTLDSILEEANCRGLVFHEMGAISPAPPYDSVREIISTGILGNIIQVFAQKSYPWTAWRPDEEAVDGGLALQVGVYVARFAEQVAGLEIKSMVLEETCLGNERPESECRRAASFLMTFQNGAVGSGIANYCCPPKEDWGAWGYETLRVFGENGFIESINHAQPARLVLQGRQPVTLRCGPAAHSDLDLILNEIMELSPVSPFSLEQRVRPTRWVIRAKHQFTNRQKPKGTS